MTEEYSKELAKEHWAYVQSICERMYVDAFVHGYKHGRYERKNND